jgi:hypothetical protein
LPDGDNFSTIK